MFLCVGDVSAKLRVDSSPVRVQFSVAATMYGREHPDAPGWPSVPCTRAISAITPTPTQVDVEPATSKAIKKAIDDPINAGRTRINLEPGNIKASTNIGIDDGANVNDDIDTRKKVYSRAYHKALRQGLSREDARAAGQLEASQRATDSGVVPAAAAAATMNVKDTVDTPKTATPIFKRPAAAAGRVRKPAAITPSRLEGANAKAASVRMTVPEAPAAAVPTATEAADGGSDSDSAHAPTLKLSGDQGDEESVTELEVDDINDGA